MWSGLQAAIREAALRRIAEHERYRERVLAENVRRARRSSVSPELALPIRPELWALDPGFDPYHVRARHRAIGHSVTRRLKVGDYAPRRPGGFWVPKKDGKSRLVGTFPIADEVISRRLYGSLLTKNRSRLSARSYAYRDDLNAYDAINYMQAEWHHEQRLFIAEYDFNDFFGNIEHEAIWESVRALDLTMTALEERLLHRFLAAPEPYVTAEQRDAAARPRTRGVPLGTSISLLLANIAVSPLDRALERLGVSFVRYADDTVIWSRDYGQLCRAVDELHSLSAKIGSPINQEKSMGVRLPVDPDTRRAEIPLASTVSFLSHDVGLQRTTVQPEVLSQLRNRITTLLYNHLLREPLRGTQDITRLSLQDRDYVAYLWQLRRYLYGSLSEHDVRRLGNGPMPAVRLRGAISRFPLVDDDACWRELDGWISTQTWLALRRRVALLSPRMASALATPPLPWGLPRQRLFTLKSVSLRTGDPLDLRLPSAVRMARVVRKAVQTHGVDSVGNATALYGD